LEGDEIKEMTSMWSVSGEISVSSRNTVRGRKTRRMMRLYILLQKECIRERIEIPTVDIPYHPFSTRPA